MTSKMSKCSAPVELHRQPRAPLPLAALHNAIKPMREHLRCPNLPVRTECSFGRGKEHSIIKGLL